MHPIKQLSKHFLTNSSSPDNSVRNSIQATNIHTQQNSTTHLKSFAAIATNKKCSHR